MSARTDVLLWARRVTARKTMPAHQVLELAVDASPQAAQEAFHKIARLAHPDLHRTTLAPDELELVTQAYSRAAAAYQEIRSTRPTSPMQPLRRPGSDPVLVPPTQVIPTSPPAHKAVSVSDDPLTRAPINPAHVMTAKALVHYRKAEMHLRRGEFPNAILQLKMAIASDPQSAFLRSALLKVEAELNKP
jgi:hypothetical protein